MTTHELTSRFEGAIVFAFRLHAKQFRKGSDISYVSHILGVTALVIEDGGDEDQAIAALLHDAVEDQGGLEMLDLIREKYGARVANIVDGCTDAYTIPKPPWKQRKVRYLEHLKEANEDVLRVSLADKLHNAYSLLKDLDRSGNEVWARFNGGMDGTLWYYRELVNIFQDSGFDSPMVNEFSRTFLAIEALAIS